MPKWHRCRFCFVFCVKYCENRFRHIEFLPLKCYNTYSGVYLTHQKKDTTEELLGAKAIAIAF